MGLRADGSLAVRIGVTPGSDDATDFLATARELEPECDFEIVEILGPPVGFSHRGALWAEFWALRASRAERSTVTVEMPEGARVSAQRVGDEVELTVAAGEPLCEVTLRSYVIGAAHSGYSFAMSEGMALNDAGEPQDLTIRSWGILGPSATPRWTVNIEHDDRPALPAGAATFAAVIALVLRETGATRIPAAQA
jgi:hypothetical protein